MSQVVTRIAPSPTGRFHVGTARTALFNYLYAKKHGGKFLTRIEDTDRERSKIEYEAEILEGLAWLGLEADETVRQSDRAPRHAELLQKLVDAGSAYVSEEESKSEKGKMVPLVRLKNPGRALTFRDEVRGDITFDTTELGDFVIARAPTDPLYHFAVVADDMDMQVTHVIRGEDHISNTPRQILIQEALGAARPVYAHLPLILDAKRAKLSKRSGATSVMAYRDEGILPEALDNYLAFLGWNPGDDREYLSLAELAQAFTLESIQRGGAVWDHEKLLSVNQHWMRSLTDDAFIARGGLVSEDGEKLRKAVPLMKERARSFAEAKEALTGELACLFAEPKIDREKLLAREPAERPGTAKTALEGALKLLEALQEGVMPEAAKEAVMPLADAEEAKGKGGRGAVLWPLRYALSGQERSPDPFTLISILGPHAAAERVKSALAILG
jgi:glutamyl-tRNA synthetase